MASEEPPNNQILPLLNSFMGQLAYLHVSNKVCHSHRWSLESFGREVSRLPIFKFCRVSWLVGSLFLCIQLASYVHSYTRSFRCFPHMWFHPTPDQRPTLDRNSGDGCSFWLFSVRFESVVIGAVGSGKPSISSPMTLGFYPWFSDSATVVSLGKRICNRHRGSMPAVFVSACGVHSRKQQCVRFSNTLIVME